MINNGIKCFVNLMEINEELEKKIGDCYCISKKFYDLDYSKEIVNIAENDGIIYYRFSIPDRNIVSDLVTINLAIKILQYISKGIPTYIHCWGGKGRTGIIICIILGLLFDLNGKDSIQITNNLFQNYR